VPEPGSLLAEDDDRIDGACASGRKKRRQSSYYQHRQGDHRKHSRIRRVHVYNKTAGETSGKDGADQPEHDANGRKA
jgi:hypothetical protein